MLKALSFTTTQFGKQLFYYQSCDSTNKVAAQLIRDQKAQHGALVLSDFQTAGRGQQSNQWESEPGHNITASLILYPNWLISQQFYLNMAISLALAETLNRFLPGSSFIKWPNDIFYQDRKLAGILIQNSLLGNKIHTSIVGMGINVNQKNYHAPRASSLLNEIGVEVSRNEVLEALMKSLEKHYYRLNNEDLAALKYDYTAQMYGIDELRSFKDQSGEFRGQITGVDTSGKLTISVEGELRHYDFQQVRYLWEERPE